MAKYKQMCFYFFNSQCGRNFAHQIRHTSCRFVPFSDKGNGFIAKTNEGSPCIDYNKGREILIKYYVMTHLPFGVALINILPHYLSLPVK
jgi:hypothetical protein